MKPPPRRYPSTNHTIVLFQDTPKGKVEHTFDVTISYTKHRSSLVPINIIFNKVGANLQALPILMDQLGTQLSQILEGIYDE